MSNPSVAVDGTFPGLAGKRSPKGAPDQARKEISDLAVVPLAELFQRLHSTETGLKARAPPAACWTRPACGN